MPLTGERDTDDRNTHDSGHSRLLATAARLSDADLLRRVHALAGREREATVELVAHLAELDARKLHLGEGYGSLFSYCTRALGLAEHAAYNRIEAARASRRFPVILDLLADGSLNLSTVRLLSPHLQPGNFEGLVSMAKGRSKREVEALVASLAPRPDVAASVRGLPAPAQPVTAPDAAAQPTALPPTTVSPGRAPATPPHGFTQNAQPTVPSGPVSTLLLAPETAGHERHLGPPPVAAGDLAGLPGAAAPELPTHRPVVTPLAPQRYRVQFTIGQAAHDRLRQAQDLLRREIPDGDPGAIFDRALTLLLEDVARKKLAAASQPRKTRPGERKPGSSAGTRSRHIPARVKREVWLRDVGRCAFVARSGRRCGERAFLEFHHREPYAVGGEATVANISLRCRRHNAYEAELAFASSELAPGRVGRILTGYSALSGPRSRAASGT